MDDDDETAAENWLEALWQTRLLGDADAVFGPVVPFFPKAQNPGPHTVAFLIALAMLRAQ